MIPELGKKTNLCEIDDMHYEEFCDLLTDNAILDDKLLPEKETNWIGNVCNLEAISHNEIKDFDKNNKILLRYTEWSNISLDNLKLIHSKYYLNTQAEENIKIDIVWETRDKNHALDYKILGVYFENKDDFEDTPNYLPSNSGYWEEWLVDLGIIEDNYTDEEH